jgi:hypothetical protein
MRRIQPIASPTRLARETNAEAKASHFQMTPEAADFASQSYGVCKVAGQLLRPVSGRFSEWPPGFVGSNSG